MDYVITVPGRLVVGLNKVVGRYNADNGTAYSVPEWLQLHTLEIAVQDELVAEQQKLVKQAEADVAGALVLLRDRLTAPEAEVPS
jgi:hypothetical protein